jgi:Mg-chelatase subunit ChlI
MAKVKTLLADEYGKRRSTGLGALYFDKDGIAEIDDIEKARRLCLVSRTLTLVEEKDKTEKPSNDQKVKSEEEKTSTKQKDKPEDDQKVKSEEEEDAEILREILTEKPIDELRELCKEAKLEGYEGFSGQSGKKELIELMVENKIGL